MSLKQNDIFYETINEWKDEIRRVRYETELRKCWLQMIEDYPEIYTIDDYFEACYRVNIPVV